MIGTNRIETTGFWMLAAALATGTVFGGEPTEYSPERYELILDRSPFGADPLLGVVDSEQKAAAAAAAAAKELRLCFLLESEGGEIRAGFQNLKAKPGDPKSIILLVGESFMGMKLTDINLAGSQATLQSKGAPVVFELSKAPAPAKAPAKKKPQPPKRQFGGGFRKREPAPPRPVEPKLSPEEQQRRREEVRANLQDYQMEVIRSGMPPLPIPLTQEMDDQLVAEGVLPPEEEE